MGKLACIFPGQGSQSVGMGLDLYSSVPEAKKAFENIDRFAGVKLSTLCFEGPESELKKTVNTQPTILAVSRFCCRAQPGRDHSSSCRKCAQRARSRSAGSRESITDGRVSTRSHVGSVGRAS